MADQDSVNRLADEHLRAMVAGDMATLDRILSPEFRLWYNVSDSEFSKTDALAVAGAFRRQVEDFRYEEVERHLTDSGYVQRHVVAGRKLNGDEFRVLTCYFVTVRDGQILKLHEYFDSAQDPRV